MKTTEIVKIEAWPQGPQIDCKIEVDTEEKTVKFWPWWFDAISVPTDAYQEEKNQYTITNPE